MNWAIIKELARLKNKDKVFVIIVVKGDIKAKTVNR